MKENKEYSADLDLNCITQRVWFIYNSIEKQELIYTIQINKTRILYGK